MTAAGRPAPTGTRLLKRQESFQLASRYNSRLRKTRLGIWTSSRPTCRDPASPSLLTVRAPMAETNSVMAQPSIDKWIPVRRGMVFLDAVTVSASRIESFLMSSMDHAALGRWGFGRAGADGLRLLEARSPNCRIGPLGALRMPPFPSPLPILNDVSRDEKKLPALRAQTSVFTQKPKSPWNGLRLVIGAKPPTARRR